MGETLEFGCRNGVANSLSERRAKCARPFPRSDSRTATSMRETVARGSRSSAEASERRLDRAHTKSVTQYPGWTEFTNQLVVTAFVEVPDPQMFGLRGSVALPDLTNKNPDPADP